KVRPSMPCAPETRISSGNGSITPNSIPRDAKSFANVKPATPPPVMRTVRCAELSIGLIYHPRSRYRPAPMFDNPFVLHPKNIARGKAQDRPVGTTHIWERSQNNFGPPADIQRMLSPLRRRVRRP